MDKLYPFRFFEIRPSPTHFKIREQILQYISYVYANFMSIEGQPIEKFQFQNLSADHP